MHTLNRNKQTVFFRNYTSNTQVTDAEGYKTGERTTNYSALKSENVYVSANQGATAKYMFGASLDYDRVITTTKTEIDEYSVLWVDVVPEVTMQGEVVTPYNYIVRKVSKSLNFTVIAIKKVSVNGN